VIVDEDENIVRNSGGLPAGTFTVDIGTNIDDISGSRTARFTLDTSSFDPDVSIFTSDDAFVQHQSQTHSGQSQSQSQGGSTADAVCQTFGNLDFDQDYYYSEEGITASSSSWEVPHYSDQHTMPISGFSDLVAYSGELFNDTPDDDDERNTNADGHITLSESRPDRTLVIGNRVHAPQPTQEEPIVDLTPSEEQRAERIYTKIKDAAIFE